MNEPIPFFGWLTIQEEEMTPNTILDINRPYTNSQQTNITETFRKVGFCFPSESPIYQEKWARFRNSNSINESGK